MTGSEDPVPARSRTARRRSPTRKALSPTDISPPAETAILTHLATLHTRQQRQQERIERDDFTLRLAKTKAFLAACEARQVEGVGPKMCAVLRGIVQGVERRKKFGWEQWREAKDRRRKQHTLDALYAQLRGRGRWMKKIEKLEAARREEALAHEDADRSRIWSLICRKQVPKTAKSLSHSISSRLNNARKVAVFCAREQQRAQHKLQKTEARDAAARSRRAMKEMLQFWKRNEREERELRKRAEKEAAERRRQEEEEREARRQDKKLQFLITQTELYSHFIARKAGSAAAAATGGAKRMLMPGIDFADLDEATLAEQAQLAAQSAVAAERAKLKHFDHESDRYRQEAGGESSTLGQDLDNLDFKAPSTLANGQVEVRQPRMLQCQLKGYQLKGLTWLANLYEQVSEPIH